MSDAEHRPFCRIRKGNLSGWLRRDFPAEPEPLLCAEKDAATQICKDRPKILAFVNGVFFVKIYRHPSWWRRFRNNFRLPRPERALRGAARLERAGIPTPQVLGALRERSGLLVRRDVLITGRLAEDSVTAAKLLYGLDAEARRELARGLCRLLAAMHANGFWHGDVSLRNLYRDGAGRLGVFDLDGCRLYGRQVPAGRREQELARLASSFDLVMPEHGVKPEDFIGFYREASKVAIPTERLLRRIARFKRHYK